MTKLTNYEFGRQDAIDNWQMLGEDFEEFFNPLESRVEQNYQVYVDQYYGDDPIDYGTYKEEYSAGWLEAIDELLEEFIVEKVEAAGFNSDHIDVSQWPKQQVINFFQNPTQGIEDVRQYIESVKDDEKHIEADLEYRELMSE